MTSAEKHSMHSFGHMPLCLPLFLIVLLFVGGYRQSNSFFSLTQCGAADDSTDKDSSFSILRTVPVTGRPQVILTSKSDENEIGAEAFEECKKNFKKSSNEEYNAALERCGNAIKTVAGIDDFQWEFIVFESDTKNAFCLPGGKVGVFSGIMDDMDNEAELAFVVGHEIGHAIARHTGEDMTRSTIQSVFGKIGKWSASSLGLNPIGGLLYEFAYDKIADYGFTRPSDRSEESEADLLGLVLMARAGYDPSASYTFWNRLTNNAEGSSKFESFFSTHPCDSDRIKDMKKNETTAREEYNKAKNKCGFGKTFTHKK